MPSIYEDGTYLANNPTWHQEMSPWVAGQALRMIRRNGLRPATVCEVGCGAGEVLRQMSLQMGPGVRFLGYEISPQAFEICRPKAGGNLEFCLGDFLEQESPRFDLLLAFDVIEHVEDIYGFLRRLKPRAENKMFHIPLELSAQSVARETPLLRMREKVGHLHVFTRRTALAAIEHAGFEVLDSFYTRWAVETTGWGLPNALLRLPRRVLSRICPHLAARLLGGFSLMVLAR